LFLTKKNIFIGLIFLDSKNGMWRSVGLSYTDVSEERIPSIFKVEGGDMFLRTVGLY
jgi:hypothetical protein